MLKKIGLGVGIAGITILGIAGAPILLGFGVGGIAAGSIAAAIQASIGNVVAGSAFAALTSLGMTGALAGTAAVGAALGTGGLVVYFKNKVNLKLSYFCSLIQKRMQKLSTL